MPASDRRGLGSAKEQPEPCPSTCIAETTSPLPLPPMTAPTRARRCRATPHGCWPSCFPSEDVCQRSQEAIAAEGFSRDRLPAMLRRLVETGFLSRHRVAQVPDTYRLHLPAEVDAR